MGIEQLLDVAYKATLPIRVVDKTIKLGFDAATSVTEKIGFDRFRLARYAAIASAISAGAGAIGYGASGNYVCAAILGLNVPLSAIDAKQTDNMREYFSNPKDILHWDEELKVKSSRLGRCLGITIVITATIAHAIGVELPNLGPGNELTRVATPVFWHGLLSYWYLIDGDHALWDKTKGKVKSAYHSLSNLMPKKVAQQQPGQTISYNQTASSIQSRGSSTQPLILRQ